MSLLIYCDTSDMEACFIYVSYMPVIKGINHKECHYLGVLALNCNFVKLKINKYWNYCKIIIN